MTLRTLLALIVSLAILGCRGRGSARTHTDQPQEDPSALPTLDSARSPVVVVEGRCPFECCQYGAWVLDTGTQLVQAPSLAAPVLASLHAGDSVIADSGLVAIYSLGIVLVLTTHVDHFTGLHLQAGDTVFLVDYGGEGIYGARWRDTTIHFFPHGVEELKVVRLPDWSWWAHLSSSPSGAGWILMDKVRVSGADACGS